MYVHIIIYPYIYIYTYGYIYNYYMYVRSSAAYKMGGSVALQISGCKTVGCSVCVVFYLLV